MNRSEISEFRPGARVKQFSSRRSGRIVPPPRGASIGLGGVYADFGERPKEVKEDDLRSDQWLVRLTIRHTSGGPQNDLKLVARLQRDLQTRLRIEIDPDNARSQTLRDKQGDLYFECVTELPDAIKEMLKQTTYESSVIIDELREFGLVCIRCRYPAGYVTKCPECNFRDVTPSPHCNCEVARELYVSEYGNLFKCPECGKRVYLELNEELSDVRDQLKEPMVIVTCAQE
jgi:hypothetical protein